MIRVVLISLLLVGCADQTQDIQEEADTITFDVPSSVFLQCDISSVKTKPLIKGKAVPKYFNIVIGLDDDFIGGSFSTVYPPKGYNDPTYEDLTEGYFYVGNLETTDEVYNGINLEDGLIDMQIDRRTIEANYGFIYGFVPCKVVEDNYEFERYMKGLWQSKIDAIIERNRPKI